jgi:hypothetical protein
MGRVIKGIKKLAACITDRAPKFLVRVAALDICLHYSFLFERLFLLQKGCHKGRREGKRRFSGSLLQPSPVFA